MMLNHLGSKPPFDDRILDKKKKSGNKAIGRSNVAEQTVDSRELETECRADQETQPDQLMKRVFHWDLGIESINYQPGKENIIERHILISSKLQKVSTQITKQRNESSTDPSNS